VDRARWKALAGVLLAVAAAGCIAGGSGSAAPSASGSASPAASVAASVPATVDGLPAVTLAELPPEAAATVLLIEAGGPFPYRQDGVVFENREGILPDRPSGYYHEYTVPTPGSTDRGARRIVTGGNGEMFWTDDHYDSFAWIAR
jgi:ribonuclease T1